MLMQLWIRMQELRNNEKGQALVEYALIVSLIAVASIIVLGLVGVDVRDALEIVEDKFDGKDETPAG